MHLADTRDRTMTSSRLVGDRAAQLAAAGQDAELVEYLGARNPSELEDSPSLALLYGAAQVRLGHHEEGLHWLDLALAQARERRDPEVERRALNARGAAALVCGQIDQAADYFTQNLMAASQDGDDATTGRCCHNLGIISHLRGRFAEAIGFWEKGVAAYARAGLRQGVAGCHHNLGIAYREQGALERALAEANQAVTEAEAAGDRRIWARVLGGRAEIRLIRNELEQSRCDLDHVRDIRRRLLDSVSETEELRVAALILAAEGGLEAAEQALHEVIARAETHGRPYLLAESLRDLVALLRRTGRTAEARAAGREAKAIFTELGAEAEIRRLARFEWDDSFRRRPAPKPGAAARGGAESGRLPSESEEAVAAALRECIVPIRSVAKRLLGDDDDSDEAVQLTLIRLWREYEAGRAINSGVALAASICRNICIDMLRTRAATRRGLTLVARSDQPMADSASAENAILGGDETSRSLWAAIKDLPRRQRVAITCRFFLGLTVKETATVMRCREGTVKATVFAAVRALRGKVPGAEGRPTIPTA